MSKKLIAFGLIVFWIVLVLAWQVLFVPRNSHQNFNDIFNSSSTGRQKLVCKPGLLKAAHAVLDGEKIPIPYGKNTTTLWEFRERAPIEKILRNMNPAKVGKTTSTTPEPYHFNLSPDYAKARKFMITFGHRCCTKSRQRAVDKALKFGIFHHARWFNMSALSPRFREVHDDVLRARRGAGYWLWKPYIGLKTLMSDEMAKGDILMYEDAGSYLLRSPEPLLKLAHEAEEGVLIFSNKQSEGKRSKRDAWILMDMEVPGVEQSDQRCGSPYLARKCCSSIQFFMEWIAYLSDRRIASDDPNTMGLPNFPTYAEHRHDQTVVSLLSKKWGLPSFRDPSQYGNRVMGIDKGPYAQILNADRWKS